MTSDSPEMGVWQCVPANTDVGGRSHGVAPPTYGSHVTVESVKKPGRHCQVKQSLNVMNTIESFQGKS